MNNEIEDLKKQVDSLQKSLSSLTKLSAETIKFLQEQVASFSAMVGVNELLINTLMLLNKEAREEAAKTIEIILSREEPPLNQYSKEHFQNALKYLRHPEHLSPAERQSRFCVVETKKPKDKK